MPTIEQVEQKIQSLKEALAFYENLRQVMKHPLFAALSSGDEEPIQTSNDAVERLSWPQVFRPAAPRQYGKLKQLCQEFLTDEPVTPQQLADKISASGYVFETKTPAISVNDTLRGFLTSGDAVIVGKSPQNANLWVRAVPPEKEAPEETS